MKGVAGERTGTPNVARSFAVGTGLGEVVAHSLPIGGRCPPDGVRACALSVTPSMDFRGTFPPERKDLGPPVGGS